MIRLALPTCGMSSPGEARPRAREWTSDPPGSRKGERRCSAIQAIVREEAQQGTLRGDSM